MRDLVRRGPTRLRALVATVVVDRRASGLQLHRPAGSVRPATEALVRGGGRPGRQYEERHVFSQARCGVRRFGLLLRPVLSLGCLHRKHDDKSAVPVSRAISGSDRCEKKLPQ